MSSKGLAFGQSFGIGLAVGIVATLVFLAITTYIFAIYGLLPKFILLTSTQAPATTQATPIIPPDADFRTFVIQQRKPNVQGIVKWKPNPMYFQTKNLPCRMTPVTGTNAIQDAAGFNFALDQLTLCCILKSVPSIPGVPHLSHVELGSMPQVPESSFNEDRLVRLAGAPVNGGTWSESLSNVKTRSGAVKCFLAQFLFKRMHPLCDVEETLLPPQIAAAYQLLLSTVPPLSDNPSGHLRIQHDTLAVWRESVWVLLHPSYTGNIERIALRYFKPEDPRAERTHAMVFEIMDALQLEKLRCNVPPDDLERRMKAIFEHAANSAMVLLCQPSVWEYEWASEKPGFMIYPAIRLVWDEDDVAYSSPAHIEEHYPPPNKSRAG